MIKNIVIDFGNVIYKVDVLAAHRKFFEIAKLNKVESNSQKINQIIDNYECGKITTNEFRENIKRLLDWNVNNDEFDHIWNSILIAPFDYSSDAINVLSRKYDLYLLSNTSKLHFDVFINEVKNIFEKFKKLYFSFEIGYKKPSIDIFKYVLQDANIIPQETVFLDDIQENLDAFSSLGVKGILINEKFNLKDFAMSF